jgi:phage shock protein C
MKESPKKLYRYQEGQVFAGILLGFAKYFSLDVTVLRVLFTLFVLITGFFPGVIAYIVAIAMIPSKACPEDDITIINL